MIVELTNGTTFEDVINITTDNDGISTLHFEDDEVAFGIIKQITKS
jgi:hypothetical protein